MADEHAIGRIAIAPPGQVHVLVNDAGFAPRIRTARLGERIQFTFLGPSLSAVTDASGLGLFDSGPRNFVSYHALVALAAGTFVLRDGPSGSNLGAIIVKVELPPTATAGIPFRATWARARPTGIVFDVEVRLPGAASFIPWTSGPSFGADYTASSPGIHFFRSRLRDPATGAATLFSTPAAVRVL